MYIYIYIWIYNIDYNLWTFFLFAESPYFWWNSAGLCSATKLPIACHAVEWRNKNGLSPIKLRINLNMFLIHGIVVDVCAISWWNFHYLDLAFWHINQHVVWGNTFHLGSWRTFRALNLLPHQPDGFFCKGSEWIRQIHWDLQLTFVRNNHVETTTG